MADDPQTSETASMENELELAKKEKLLASKPQI